MDICGQGTWHIIKLLSGVIVSCASRLCRLWAACSSPVADFLRRPHAKAWAAQSLRWGTTLKSAWAAPKMWTPQGGGTPRCVSRRRRPLTTHAPAQAVEHGNTDAPERLTALSQPSPQALSRTQHNQITDAKLVRKHTQAKMSAAAAGRHAQTLSAAQGHGVVGKIQAQASAQPPPPPPQQQQRPPQPSHAHSRYSVSLSDSPPAPSPPPTRTPPAAGGRAAGRPPGRRQDAHAGSPTPAAQPHPASPAPGHPGSPALPPPERRLSPPQGSAGPPAVRKASGTGPATFAEMGFQSGKAEDKECVIM